MEEIWRDIEGYEGLYQVSNLGRVKALKKTIIKRIYKYNLKERIKKHMPSPVGYCMVSLTKNSEERKQTVHRLVACAFIPNPENKPQVNHINGTKSDNRVENLEWCTSQENNIHAVKTGLKVYSEKSGKPKRKIKCLDTGEIFESINDAHRKSGLHRKTLWLCCQGKQNKTGGLRWKYYTEQ